MFLPLFILSAPIIIADVQYRRIPNVYLGVLAYCLIPHLLVRGFGEFIPLLVFISAAFLMSFLGMGMGDFKLLSLIGVWLNIRADSSFGYFAALLLAISATHILWASFKSSSIPNSIPMAPSIFLALSLYLATQ